MRAALCRKLTSLGVKLDDQANASDGPCISATDSAVSVWVIPTNQELMIAQHTLALVKEQGSNHVKSIEGLPADVLGMKASGGIPHQDYRDV